VDKLVLLFNIFSNIDPHTEHSMKGDLISFVLLLKVIFFDLDFLVIYTDIYISSICIYVRCMTVISKLKRVLCGLHVTQSCSEDG